MLLNGQWKCSGGDDGEHRFSIVGIVPGCVTTDLIAAGLLPDLFYRDQAEEGMWVERCDVRYEKTFFWEGETDHTQLTFDGLDVYCDVYLNGIHLGECHNMFYPHVFSLDGVLQQGDNTLRVDFYSPVKKTENLLPRSGAFTTERLYTRRVQCSYGWDWVGRFVTMGIWRDVHIERLAADRLEDIYVYTDSLNAYAAKIVAEADFVALSGEGEAEFQITAPDGRTVWQRKRKLYAHAKGADTLRLTEYIDIPNPALWYPLGYGAQPLYTLRVRTPAGEKMTRFGIRTVEILEIEDAPDSSEAKLAKKLKAAEHLREWDKNEGSSSFTVLVNGKKIFCQGANWVPCEPFPSAETPEKIRSLLHLAGEGHLNMLRVWGGGVFEHDAFYDTCDEEGILVTQDFLMACGSYPEEDDAFINELKKETHYAARKLRNHPCLIYYSGDNENAVRGSDNLQKYPGRRAALEAIGPVLRMEDPHRRFLPSSPYGGIPYASAVRGTTHNTQFLGNFFQWVREGDFREHRAYMEQYLARFTAEQPALGMPYVSTLRRFMTDEDIFGEDTRISEYHTKTNPGLGTVTIYDYIDRMSRGIFGEYTSGADRVRKMQMLQCEWIRTAMELFRRNMWFSSGIIFWMFNDCWPAANGWSLLDYYGNPKPSFYAFQRCAKDLIVSISGENGVYRAYLSSLHAENTIVRYRFYTYDIRTGAEAWETSGTCTAPAGGVLCISETDTAPDACTVLLCDIETENGEHDRAFYLPLRFGDMQWEEGAETILAEDENSVTVRADVCLPYLLLDTPHRLCENSIFLKKGETCRIEKMDGTPKKTV